MTPTKRVRVQLDFVLEFPETLTRLPYAGEAGFERACIHEALAAAAKALADRTPDIRPYLAPGGKMRAGLDNRPEKTKRARRPAGAKKSGAA